MANKTFWGGALGTPRQKCFWIGFSVLVGVIAIIVMATLMPPIVLKHEYLRAGEWIHIYPDSFWHSSADYSFTTVPKDGSKGNKFTDGRAFVYDISKYGRRFSYHMESTNPLDKFFLLGQDNWTTDIYMTTGSSFTVTLTPRSPSIPIDFLATTSEFDMDVWIETGNRTLGLDALEYIQHSVDGLSVVVEQPKASDKFLYGMRVYLGLMASPDTTMKSGVSSMSFSRYIRTVPEINCTNFTAGKASLPAGSLSLLQVNAPDACTDENVKECIVEIWLQPRWIIFIILVVIPVILVSIGLVIGLIALRALQVKQMIAYMRKKAAEEGVALEEGKSKDIHAEKLEQHGDDDEEEKPVQEEGKEEEEVDEPKDDEEKPKESSGAAVLTTSGGDDEH